MINLIQDNMRKKIEEQIEILQVQRKNSTSKKEKKAIKRNIKFLETLLAEKLELNPRDIFSNIFKDTNLKDKIEDSIKTLFSDSESKFSEIDKKIADFLNDSEPVQRYSIKIQNYKEDKNYLYFSKNESKLQVSSSPGSKISFDINLNELAENPSDFIKMAVYKRGTENSAILTLDIYKKYLKV